MDWTSKEFAERYGPAEAMTGPFGRHLLTQCGLDRADGSEDIVLLDNATGTGIDLVHLYDVLPQAAKERLQVVAGDISPAMIESAKARIEKNGWQGITAQVVDATVRPASSGPATPAHRLTANPYCRKWTYRRTISPTSSPTSRSSAFLILVPLSERSTASFARLVQPHSRSGSPSGGMM